MQYMKISLIQASTINKTYKLDEESLMESSTMCLALRLDTEGVHLVQGRKYTEKNKLGTIVAYRHHNRL